MNNPQEQKKISEIITGANLPALAEFIGYVIWLEDSDEFLVKYTTENHQIGCIWTKVPDVAKKYKTFKKAKKILNEIEKDEADIGWMFDLGDSYFVSKEKATN